MAQGEAEHGCVQGEPCRLGGHEQYPGGKPARRGCGGNGPDRDEIDPTVPRQRVEEGEPERPARPECCTELRGWAGAHRHGAVRPGSRRVRRERPPQRWC